MARILAAAIAAVLATAVIGVLLVTRELDTPRAEWSGSEIVVELPRGMSARAMLDVLAEHGVLRHPALAGLYLRWHGGAGSLHAGEYRFDHPVSTFEVLERLRRGDVLLHPVTLPEGLDLAEVARRLQEAGLHDAAVLEAAFRNPAAIRDLDPEAPDLEGYLFPDTYLFSKEETPPRIAEVMVRRFREAVGETYAARAAGVGLSLRQAVTLASMIEKETSVPDERGRISRVFHNRLARGMKLQCDPTVRFALERAGKPIGRLTYRDLELDSPYNTYRVGGLPPGPICSPGKASLDAAVDPTAGDELYFVASPDGGHRFSATLEGHLRAVAEWRDYVRSSR